MSKQLKLAIEQNDPELARKAVKTVKDLNRKLPGSMTPLLLACTLGADKVLPVLVESGARVKGTDSYAGNHPFCAAAKNGQTAVLSKLVEMGQAPDDVIDHALFVAAIDAREDVLRFLVRHYRPNPGAMVVRVACNSRNPGVIRAVAEGTGAVNATEDAGPTGRGLTPLHSSVGHADVEVVRTLVECGADVNARDALGRTPLMHLGHDMERLRMNGKEPAGLGLMKELVRIGANAGAADHDGNDVIDHYVYELHRSKEAPDPAVLEFLRGAGASGSRATFDLFLAIQRGDLDVVQRALHAGADPNRIGPPHWDSTPLTMASRRAQPEIVDALLRAGADVNKPDRSETPLMAAAAFNNLPVVKQLVEAGADLEALEVYPPADGVPRANAYLIAENRGSHDVVDYLRSLGSGRPEPAKDWKPIEAGVHHWDDFEELLVKGDVGPVARGLAKAIGGSVEPQAYGKTFVPQGRAYVVARPAGMRWCNVLQVAPPRSRRPDQRVTEEFHKSLADACGSPVLSVGYSDTSDAASLARYEPGGAVSEDQGWDRDTLEEVVDNMGDEAPAWMKQRLAEMGEKTDDELSSSQRLEKLARDERFAVGALYVQNHPGRPVEVTFVGLPQEAFDGVAWVGS